MNEEMFVAFDRSRSENCQASRVDLQELQKLKEELLSVKAYIMNIREYLGTIGKDNSLSVHDKSKLSEIYH